MSGDGNDDLEGLEPKKLLGEVLGGGSDDPEGADRSADEEHVRAEIEKRLPDLELLELIGRGGMGYVYRARQTKLERDVALKVIAPDPGRRDGFQERFAREARALARLNHPNLVAIYDYGQEDDFAWLLMEYVEGSNLRDLIRGGKLTPAEALALVPKICDALQFAHDHGVVHRDVKPENILVDGDGGVKIADFGLAKLIGAPVALVSLTATQQVLGTFRYMAPEQLDRPLEVDHRADIYSLGVVFYEMLTGEVPMGRFDPPSRHSSTSEKVDDVVLRALARAPDRRYQRASDVKSDLESLDDPPARTESREQRPRAESEAPTRRLSRTALVSALLLVASGMLFIPAMVAMVGDPSGRASRGEDPEFGTLMVLLVAFFSLLGFVSSILGSVLGFRALHEIRREWPRLYGTRAAVLGAWLPILFFGSSLVAGMFSGVSEAAGPPTMLLMLLLSVVLLVVLHRRFVERCGAKSG